MAYICIIFVKKYKEKQNERNRRYRQKLKNNLERLEIAKEKQKARNKIHNEKLKNDPERLKKYYDGVFINLK